MSAAWQFGGLACGSCRLKVIHDRSACPGCGQPYRDQPVEAPFDIAFIGHAPTQSHTVVDSQNRMLCHADDGLVVGTESYCRTLAQALNAGARQVNKAGRLLPHPALRHAAVQASAGRVA